MSHYSIQLAKQELLHHMLQVGGSAVVHLHSLEQVIEAHFTVELTDTQAITKVTLGEHQAELTLRRSNRANHLSLRDFIEDIANGLHENGSPRAPAACDASIQTQPALNEADERTLRDLIRSGGCKHLACGASVTVHNALNDPQRHALVTVNGKTSWLSEHSGGSLYAHVAGHLEQQLAA